MDQLNLNGLSVDSVGNIAARTLAGSLDPARTPVNDDDYTCTGAEQLVAVTALTGPISINLPPPASMRGEIVIKDESGNATDHDITINTPGSETIDGAASLVIDADYGYARIYTDGTNYFSL